MICDPDQDAAKHFRTKEEASSKHRMWGVEKQWPRHKLALNTETAQLAAPGWQDLCSVSTVHNIFCQQGITQQSGFKRTRETMVNF